MFMCWLSFSQVYHIVWLQNYCLLSFVFLGFRLISFEIGTLYSSCFHVLIFDLVFYKSNFSSYRCWRFQDLDLCLILPLNFFHIWKYWRIWKFILKHHSKIKDKLFFLLVSGFSVCQHSEKVDHGLDQGSPCFLHLSSESQIVKLCQMCFGP